MSAADFPSFSRAFLQRLRGSKFGRHVAIITGGTVIGRTITALASPLLSRIYTPSDFGVLSVFFSTTTMLVIIGAFNYEAAIPLPKEDEAGLGVLAVSFGVLALNTLICGLIVLLFGSWVAHLLGAASLWRYLWLLPVGLLGGGTFFVLNSWAIRVQEFKSLAKRRITQSALQVLVQLAAPLFARGPIGLLLGDCAGRAGGSLALLADTREYIKIRRLHLSWNRIMEGAIRYKRFPIFGMTSVLLHTALTALPALLLARLFGLQEAGWFGMVNQILGIAVGLIGLGVAQVFLSNAAQLAHTSPRGLRSLFLKTSRIALLAGVPPIALVLFAGPRLFGIIFGTQWMEAGVYGQLLALPFLVMLAVGPVFPALTVLERQDWQVAADGIGLVIMFFGMQYVHHTGRSGRWGIAVYGVAISVTYLLLFVLAYYAICNHCAKAGFRKSDTPLVN